MLQAFGLTFALLKKNPWQNDWYQNRNVVWSFSTSLHIAVQPIVTLSLDCLQYEEDQVALDLISPC